MGDMEGKQLLLVLGAPRSGTTWLHRMLAAHSDTASLDRELTVMVYLQLWDKLYQKEKFHLDQGHWRQGAPLLYTPEEFDNGLRAIAHNAYARVLARNTQATHILDKHPAYALYIPVIARLFPAAKVVHIIRDGREVVVSMMSAKRRIGFGEGGINGASRDWARHVALARRDGMALGPDRYLEVRYEELMACTAPGLKDIFRFADLPAGDADIGRIAEEYRIGNNQVSRGDDSLNELRKEPGAIWRNKLGLEERWTMDRMVGHLLREFNRAEAGWWAVKSGDKARMALIHARKRMMNTIGSAVHAWRRPFASRYDP